MEDIDFLNIRIQLKFFMARVIQLVLARFEMETTQHLYAVVKNNSLNKEYYYRSLGGIIL